MRYRTLDLPPSKAAAFMPLPAATPTASSAGLSLRVGAPGTWAIPAPNGAAESLPPVSNQRGVNSARPGDVSPDVWYPAIYIALADNQGPEADGGIGMARRRYAELPVPALNPTRVPVSDSLVTRKGSRVAQPWPRAFQRFPTSQDGGV